MGLSLWHMGYPAKAIEFSARALGRANDLNHLYSAAMARLCSSWLCLLRGDGEAQQEAESLVALSAEHGYPYTQVQGLVWRGCALLRQSPTIALKELKEIIGRLVAIGGERTLTLPYVLSVFADAHGRAANPKTGLILIADALAQITSTLEREAEAELYRVKGELLLKQDDTNTADAQRCFQRAIEIARTQSAKSWELRATTSLARLLAKQGRRDEARAMLAEIYSWFTEGFDTADLKDAKALLDQLAT